MIRGKTFILSRHLSLENLDIATDVRVIVNTLTGQRLQMTSESMKILEAFQTPRTLSGAIQHLGINGKGVHRKFRSILFSLIKASFLINVSEVTSSEPRSLRKIIESDYFVQPKISFAHCPSVKVTEIKKGEIVIAGIGIDQATTGSPGTRRGPEQFREVSTRFITYDRDIFTLANRGWYNADRGKIILKDTSFVDVGNVVHHLSENASKLYERCYRAALTLYRKKAFPIFIGGDHSISAPLIRACRKTNEKLTVIHFDAHTDLAEWDSSTSHHHGNVMSRVVHENPELEIYQFGIRGFAGNPSTNKRCHVITQREIDTNLEEVLSKSIPKDRTCYISFDVDVIDPNFAPGTGTPVPMGMMPHTMLRLMEVIAHRNQIVGMDIVELCPHLDRNDITTSLAFHLLMYFLSWMHK